MLRWSDSRFNIYPHALDPQIKPVHTIDLVVSLAKRCVSGL
jgi:hypothetical protein